MPCCVRTMPKPCLTPRWPKGKAGFPGLEAGASIDMVRAGRVSLEQHGMQGCSKAVPVGQAVPEEHSDIQRRFFFLNSCGTTASIQLTQLLQNLEMHPPVRTPAVLTAYPKTPRNSPCKMCLGVLLETHTPWADSHNPHLLHNHRSCPMAHPAPLGPQGWHQHRPQTWHCHHWGGEEIRALGLKSDP